MTTPKEALEAARNALVALRVRLNAESAVQGRGWVSLGIVLNDAVEKADSALASLQGEDAVERVKVLARRFWSIHPSTIAAMNLTREEFYAREMTKLLATGLVPDEAAKERVDTVVSECGLEGAAAGWRPCSGCYETEDGRPVGKYPYSDLFKCDTGSGCHECGGLGVVWEYHSASDLAYLEQQLHEPDPFDEAAIRADEWEKQRERDAEIADCIGDKYDATSFMSPNAEQVAALRSKEQAAHDIAAAIRSGGGE